MRESIDELELQAKGRAVELTRVNIQPQQEIIERQQAETALRESEQRFRAIFDGAFQFIGLLSTQGIVVEANRTALEAIGAERSQVIGQPFWEAPWWTHSPELQNKLKQGIVQATTGELVRFEVKHLLADGTPVYVDFSLKPVLDKEGNVIIQSVIRRRESNAVPTLLLFPALPLTAYLTLRLLWPIGHHWYLFPRLTTPYLTLKSVDVLLPMLPQQTTDGLTG
jgi:PAS domain S-box-containing protein